jgi:DNA primase
MAFDRNTVSQIIQGTDIVSLISDYVPLKKAGQNFKGLCPFHKEKTSSFLVSPDKQIFHCFGCGEGGDAIKFLMKVEHLEFPQAVKILADKLGIVLDDKHAQSYKSSDEKELLFDINKKTAQFYHRYLLESKDSVIAKKYLEKRGVDKSSIENFLLGYAPSSYSSLINAALKSRQNIELFEKIGLVRKDSYNKYRDWFRNRLMFPIFDVRGKIVGFGGRVLDDSLPKYLNSPETVLFRKSSTLYGLNFSAKNIREKNKIVILEGYMDLIGLYQYGIKNVAATLGTALTNEHVNIIRRYANQVIVVFDGDTAGVNASMRTVELFLNSGLELKIVSLPDDLDPDEYVREYGAEKLNELFDNAIDGFKFQINTLIKSDKKLSTQEKKNVCAEVFRILEKVENRLEQNYVIKLLSEKLKESEEDIKYEFERFVKSNTKRRFVSKEKEDTKKSVISYGSKAELDFLEWIVYNKENIEKAQEKIELDWIQTEYIKNIVSWIFENKEKCKTYTVGEFLRILMDEFNDENLSRLFSGMFLDEYAKDLQNKILDDIITALKRNYFTARMKQIEKQLAQDPNVDKEKLAEYEKIAKIIKGSL